MALNVNDLYVFTQKLIRKNQSGSLTATEFNLFWNDAQRAYMADLLGRFQLRSNGKLGGNTGIIMNETILTKLAPFTKQDAALAISGGSATKPTGMIYRLALRTNNHDIVFINHGQIANVKNSVIDAPSVANNLYYAYEIEGTYKFLPTTITTAEIDYIVDVTDIVWGYTLDGNGRQVYSSGASTQSKWDDISNMEITKRMLQDIGVSLKDRDFQNFGSQTIITGD